MPVPPPIYGFDLLTNAVGNRLDPHNRITEVALSLSSRVQSFDGEEAEMLCRLNERLRELPAGVVATWNGSLLALPFLAIRANALGIELDLALRLDRREAPTSPISGVDHAVCARWGQHEHLDLRRVYHDGSRRKKKGLDPESLIPPANDLARRDPARDALLARRLSERRWPQARKFVDRMPIRPGSGTDSSSNGHQSGMETGQAQR